MSLHRMTTSEHDWREQMGHVQVPRRTHSSSALAFRRHTDYACALEVAHLPLLKRLWRWLVR